MKFSEQFDPATTFTEASVWQALRQSVKVPRYTLVLPGERCCPSLRV